MDRNILSCNNNILLVLVRKDQQKLENAELLIKKNVLRDLCKRIQNV